MYTRATVCLICTLLQACTIFSPTDTWPSELPARQLFIEQCQNCATAEQQQEHLLWIKRFYQGSILYPTGWHDMTDLLTSSLEQASDKIHTKQRLDDLGYKIVIEWAKDNQTRLINSQQLAIWGRALRTSAERNEQLNFISVVENDVDKILAKELSPKEITEERYYPAEDYDNF